MATVKRSGGAAGSRFFKPAAKPSAKPSVTTAAKAAPKTAIARAGIGKRKTPFGSELTLPTGPEEPEKDFRKVITLLFGEKKIGKTSFCSHYPKAIFLMTEPGGKGLRIARRPARGEPPMTWKQFTQYVRILESDTVFQTVITDTLDRLYKLCYREICRQHGVTHPSQKGYGVVWDAIKAEFEEWMERLVGLDKGVVFTSHAKDKEFLNTTGDRYNKLVPSADNAPLAWAAGIADIIAYYGYYGRERYITILGSDSLEAGHRMEEQFWTANGKERVHSIPMGKSSLEGFTNFERAFYNKQEKSYLLDEEDTGLSNRPAPFIKDDKKTVRK